MALACFDFKGKEVYKDCCAGKSMKPTEGINIAEASGGAVKHDQKA